jgi:hypothetical protein
LQKLRNTIFLWKLVVKKKKRRKISSRLLRRTSKKADIYNPVAYSLVQAIKAEAAAIKALRAAKSKATKWRKDHNTTLSEAQAKKKGIPPEQENKSMNRTEADCRQARRVRRMNKKFKTNGLFRIEIQQADGSVKNCVTKEAIEDGCIDETFLKYSQTNKTPPMTSPLLDDIGYLASTAKSQQILVPMHMRA